MSEEAYKQVQASTKIVTEMKAKNGSPLLGPENCHVQYVVADGHCGLVAAVGPQQSAAGVPDQQVLKADVCRVTSQMRKDMVAAWRGALERDEWVPKIVFSTLLADLFGCDADLEMIRSTLPEDKKVELDHVRSALRRKPLIEKGGS
uniref:Uncharacterized protein n=1 Tax=Chromera velia CCMP2878 TaxID=1169474 RepID=A0A0G4IC23_9ALVE|eukprot:Cvel_12897.t1-p1 / transcript=Cvel_12897.t1 / gene=Cvel_12897 / organism=Chromera_velia_CCMP2878 / gene_product=hypothetical protein / transcript_product=hypothetical protein / location=Cvel_scaffold862:130-567(-) / protein_length=146 / sequence_SO=supercontig / SO=protein_coding / is_pseudo=false